MIFWLVFGAVYVAAGAVYIFARTLFLLGVLIVIATVAGIAFLVKPLVRSKQ